MFHNIKADIIYYKTTTDFELEFNLCGCCRMRLLSDKMQDKKSFVHSLARAVSRSSVILVAGPLFGEDGTIKTVTEALNTSTETVDKTEYAITDGGEIQIIKNSTPLVTPEGNFGGCIIESGPQTMILLTDDKQIRKTIMKDLIHPYIEELYNAESATKEPPAEEPTAEDITENEVLITDISAEQPEETETEEIEETEQPALETEEVLSESEEEIVQDAPEDGITEDETAQIICDEFKKITEDEVLYEDDTELLVEPDRIDRKASKLRNDYYTEDDDYDNLYGIDEEDNDQGNSKTFKFGLNLAVLIISVILLLVIAVLCYCIFIVPARQGVSPVSNLQEIFNTMFG